ncbi:cyclic nucleotide-binding protein [Rhodovibrio sodomensis]|uniref:Cyclic nucleotide-binding protein n=1 Tax=Rhodovibrio sodomensis TaxID=1088 RepID=A0ABS1DLF3_9PROT|nr:Crp/Fnr family transcriptional regulator [Rhodovibrio sodomensis]MBK1671371.1 cyclic nucleotide-binding protein [Rhodovibrio sodomensis]
MGLEQEVEVLRRIPLFQNIEPSKLKLMAFASERVTFADGAALFDQGEEGDAAYIVLEGTADVRVTADSGEPITVAQVASNDIVGEIAILCNVPRTATVVATSELVTLKITKELFFRMVQDFPQIGIEVMRVLAHRLETTTRQLRAARGG